ncbi:MAG: HEAT repeat domain-containing protein [Bacteroidota bacterium]
MKTNKDVEMLIANLQSKDGMERLRARKKLVKIGRPAVPSLMELLSDRKQHVRWEGCKALGEMMDPTSAPGLVKALTDESVEVRWLAAEGLIALEKKALVPLLKILETDFESPYVREGAHHVLHALEREHLLSKDSIAVLEALRYLEPKVSVALAASKALQSNSKSG